MIAIPDRKQCLELMQSHDMMEHIMEHSFKVAEVAILLATQLAESAIALNKSLIEAASLLHDIAKIAAIGEGKDHSLLGAGILEAQGFPAVAEVVKQHVRLSGPVSGTSISEAEIVNYADKRVLHTTIVSLGQRFDYIREKYGRNDPVRLNRIGLIQEETEMIEAKLFERIPINPEDVELLLRDREADI